MNIFNNESSEKDKKKILGKKRIRLSKKLFHIKNKNIENINFDSFLNVKKFSEPENNKNMQDFRDEFELLKSEVFNNRKLYVNLQQSIIYLKTNNKDKFINSTYKSLKNILLQDIKISNFKTRLFCQLITKSHIKDYFKLKDDIFNDKSDDEEDIIDIKRDEEISISINSDDEDDLNNSMNFIGEFEKIKKNLFVTKTKIYNSKLNKIKIN